jgi:hypothetical protein
MKILTHAAEEANKIANDVPVERQEEARGGARLGAGRHAGSDPTKTSHLIARIEPTRKAAYVRAASAEGLKLAPWMIKYLDEKANYCPEANLATCSQCGAGPVKIVKIINRAGYHVYCICGFSGRMKLTQREAAEEWNRLTPSSQS